MYTLCQKSGELSIGRGGAKERNNGEKFDVFNNSRKKVRKNRKNFSSNTRYTSKRTWRNWDTSRGIMGAERAFSEAWAQIFGGNSLQFRTCRKGKDTV